MNDFKDEDVAELEIELNDTQIALSFYLERIKRLEQALKPLADAWVFQEPSLNTFDENTLNGRFFWKPYSTKIDIPGISLLDGKNAFDILSENW